MDKIDRSINIVGWVIAVTLLAFLPTIAIYGQEFDAITKASPGYGLLVMFIPAVVIGISANILGKEAREKNVPFSYIKNKLFMQPAIWLSILISAAIAGFCNGS